MLGANRELAGAEVELVGLDQREQRLKLALAEVAADYDFVLIDCPPSLSLLTLNGLCAANGVIVPMQCEYFALEGVSDLVNTIKQVRANLNRELRIIGLLRVMFDAHHAAEAGQRPAVRAFRRRRVPDRDPAQRAAGRGAELRPAWRGVRPLGACSKAFVEFAREMVERIQGMSHVSRGTETDAVRVLVLPGWQGSGPDHWQTAGRRSHGCARRAA